MAEKFSRRKAMGCHQGKRKQEQGKQELKHPLHKVRAKTPQDVVLGTMVSCKGRGWYVSDIVPSFISLKCHKRENPLRTQEMSQTHTPLESDVRS